MKNLFNGTVKQYIIQFLMEKNGEDISKPFIEYGTDTEYYKKKLIVQSIKGNKLKCSVNGLKGFVIIENKALSFLDYDPCFPFRGVFKYTPKYNNDILAMEIYLNNNYSE